jgi:hypothetical protein
MLLRWARRYFTTVLALPSLCLIVLLFLLLLLVFELFELTRPSRLLALSVLDSVSGDRCSQLVGATAASDLLALYDVVPGAVHQIP